MDTKRNYYLGQIIPEDNTIYVFGSNKKGNHIYGYALIAKKYFGAVENEGCGLFGNSYALPMYENIGKRDISESEIKKNIEDLYKIASSNLDKIFKISFNKCLDNMSLSGYSEKEIAEMFKDIVETPPNIIFPEHWRVIFEN